jgi:internalin A
MPNIKDYFPLVVATIGFVVFIYAFLSALARFYRLRRAISNLNLYGRYSIEHAGKYYIRPRCTSIDPSLADSVNFIATSEDLFNAVDRILDDHEYRHVLLLGTSGSGKTSFLLNYYLYNASKPNRKRHLLAIVPLGMPDSDRLIHQIPHPEETTIFLDALDEDVKAIADRAGRIRELITLCLRFKRVFITSRTQFFPSDEEIPRESGIIRVGPRHAGEIAVYQFFRLYLLPFSDEDVKKYLNKRYPVWRYLERRKAYELAVKIPMLTLNPMLLTHLDELIRLPIRPQTSFQLYELMINAWVERERGWVSRETLLEISELLARDIYLNSQVKGIERISRAEIDSLIKEYSPNLSEWQIGSRSLLVRDDAGNLTFAHRSIMEYFFVRRLAKGDERCFGQPLSYQMKQFLLEMIDAADEGQLSNLTYLDLSTTSLTAIPESLTKLVSLKRLDVQDNLLTSLPITISKLANLSHLDLSNNSLEALPSEMEELTKLDYLDLAGNPLNTPPEIIEKRDDPNSIMNYYFQRSTSGRQPLNEAKVLIVGQGAVGKTSIVRRLVEGRFDPHEKITEGINISNWTVVVDDREIRLNIWDFGGQEILHATHQFFLTKRSLYLLVLDGRVAEHENRIEYWLKIIESFSEASPVLVIINKIDQHALKVDQRTLKYKYPSIIGFIETSCSEGTGIESLKEQIRSEVSGLQHVSDSLPLTWFAVKSHLELMEDDFISYSTYQSICVENGIEDDFSQRELLSFLHDLGTVLNYLDDPRLHIINILNPEWVTKGVYSIINSEVLSKRGGILLRSDLKNILSSESYPSEQHLFILDMMRKFELCYALEEMPDEKFLVPELLPKEKPPFDWDHISSLGFEYRYNVLPTSILSRFIVRMHHSVLNEQTWRNGVVLRRENNDALIIADYEEKTITISIQGDEAGRRFLLEIIRSNFDHVHRTIPKIDVTEVVPLPDLPDIKIDYEDLRQLDKVGIEEHYWPKAKSYINIRRLLDGIETAGGREVRDYSKSPKQATETVDSVLMMRLGDLRREKNYLDTKANRTTQRYLLFFIFGVLLPFYALLAWLTYRFGWDVMEPYTYYVGSAAILISYLYFAFSRREWSPAAIYNQILETRRLRNYEESGFNLKVFERLEQELTLKGKEPTEG